MPREVKPSSESGIIRAASDSLSVPGWVIKALGVVVTIVGVGAPVWSWTTSVDTRLARIEERIVGGQEVMRTLIDNHERRLNRIESDVQAMQQATTK